MSRSFTFLPDGDIENDGWTLVGGSSNSVWEILGYYEDDCHVRCPVYRGGIEVRFPFDYVPENNQFPEGAIIDSITVMVRMKTNSGSGARGVTINVLSTDNRSRYTTRTIYATSTLPGAPDWGVEVGTYTKDPLGRPWDIHRLNKLRLRMFSHNNLSDSVRVYGLWCVVNFHTKPSVSVSSPTGTVNTPSPTVAWNYSQDEGEPQKSAEYKIFTLAQASTSTFNPNTADAIYQTTVSGIANSYILPTSLNNNDYVVYVRSQSQFGAWSSWANKQFTVSAPSPGVPGDDNAGLSGVPGIGTPTVVPDNYTSSASVRMIDTSNLLSVQQADFEIASDPLGYVGDNATLARNTAHAFGAGVASMSVTATASGTASAVSTAIELAASMPMTLTAQVRAGDGVADRTVNLRARFYDETHTLITDPDTSEAVEIVDTITDTSGTWVEATATGTSPATAKYAEVVVEVEGAEASEVHYVDHVGLMYGANTAWSDGGHMSRNMLTSFLATGDDPESSVNRWVSLNSATTMDRVETSGVGSHGLMCNQMTCQAVDGTIGFRAAGTSGTGTIFNSTSSGKDFKLWKPTSPNTVQENDLLIAFVTSNEFGTINPPPGWTAVNTAAVDDGSTDVALWILKRTAGASDPASWDTGTLSVNSDRRSAVVVAYSGAANASEQFLADAVRTDSTGALAHRTAEVMNTDPNAWRISAFAANDDHSLTSSMTANTGSGGSTPPPISFVGKSTPWWTASDTFKFTLNRPSNVQSGDLMLASVVFSGIVSGTPSVSGWTFVQKIDRGAGDGDWHSGATTMCIFRRTAGSSEPNSWTSNNHNDWGRPKLTQVVAYRNVDTTGNPFIDTADSEKSNSSSITTGTVTNNNSSAWRVCIFGGTTNFASSWNGGDVSERADASTSVDGYPDPVVQFSDSGGSVSTGDHSRSASMASGSYFTATSFIGLLKPLASALPTGPAETERVEFTTGSSVKWTDIGVYDSGDSVNTGLQSVWGVIDTTDGNNVSSVASWIGLIKPEDSTQGGTVQAVPEVMIDIDSVDDAVLSLANRKLTMMADFRGPTASGTPALEARFYRANQFLGSQSAIGNTFDTDGFTKSWAVFDIPEGTTRILPVLSALDREVDDTVHFDRVAVMLGALDDPEVEPQWRNGTARPEHPVWAKPTIEYQENDGTGYGEWKLLAGQKALPPYYDLNLAQMTYVDHTIVPLNSRRYRVSTMSYGLNGDFFSSGFGPASREVIFEPNAWWLKDIQDLSKNIQISVRWKDMQVDTANMATTFQPIGSDFPVVVTEGFKGDTFSLEIHCEQAEFTSLMKLLNSGRTLILQSDIDKMWWVRPTGNIQANILATSSRKERPRRYVTVTFVQVAPEE